MNLCTKNTISLLGVAQVQGYRQKTLEHSSKILLSPIIEVSLL
jgi:hypothetical protein